MTHYIFIALVLIIGIFALFYLEKMGEGGGKVKTNKKFKPTANASDFVNVYDIEGDSLITRDGYIIKFLRIYPISIELFTDREKEVLKNNLSIELSKEDLEFKFLSFSRPIDITPVIDNLQMKLSETANTKRRELLRSEIKELTRYALSGEVVERRFYFQIYSKNNSNGKRLLENKVEHIKGAFSSATLKCGSVAEKEIIQICNLINNPKYVHLEE